MSIEEGDRVAGIGFIDDFEDDRPQGAVVGQANRNGIMRHGIDVENVVSIDCSALRISSLVQPGWGRAGLAYGPYRRANGLTFAAFVLDGHNTSQVDGLSQSLFRRFGRWAKGSETEGIFRRMLSWVAKGDKRTMVRRAQHWWWLYRHTSNGKNALNENMALGWFASKAPTDPLRDANAFVMHAAGPENGELWANAGDQPLHVLRGVQNLPIYYVVVLRERGAAYYAASLAGTRNLGSLPKIRPMAIDAFHQEGEVFAGIHQSVLGQIGFRVDTRVYSAQVALLPELGSWYGTAHAADSLIGSGPLTCSTAERGGSWIVLKGQFERTCDGACSGEAFESLAVLDSGAPTSLVHLLIRTEASEAFASVVWRFVDADNFWCLSVSHSSCRVWLTLKGMRYEIASVTGTFLCPKQIHAVQIRDDGDSISPYLDGRALFDLPINDPRIGDATGVGFGSSGSSHDGPYFSRLEAHPREIVLPSTLRCPKPWQERGDVVAIRDNFMGAAGQLDRRKSCSGQEWRRIIGRGEFDVQGDGHVRVRANVAQPNPGRTAYTLPWDAPDFAELAVTIQPPGSGRHEGHKGRGGLIFWQDTQNYIIINNWLDDVYGGASVSTFFHINGFEELYDAVWTNVGDRVSWGRKHSLRVAFDGLHYLAYVDGELVLYRALTDVYPATSRLRINRVGIVANWEWGNDTGSQFSDFVALKTETER